MPATRTQRRAITQTRRRQLLAAGVVLALLAAGAAAAAFAIGGMGGGGPSESAEGGALAASDTTGTAASDAEAGSDASAPVSTLASTSAAASAFAPNVVEVPDVVGKELVEAELVLTLAGFDVRRAEAVSAPQDEGRRVLGQTPKAGDRVPQGEVITLSHAPAPPKAPKVAAGRYVVCIDPGHQAKSDSRTEPLGPGSQERKARVLGGSTGVSTGIPESEVVLRVSERLAERLRKAGVRVVMTRTSNEVNISNAERAAIANKAGADLFVRVHCDGSPDAEMSGASTLYPAPERWTKSISARSRRAALHVQRALVRSTGAVDRGVTPRADITGFNWSKVPAILVECGFLSNSVEDKLLNSAPYQDKLAAGMASGILVYLGE